MFRAEGCCGTHVSFKLGVKPAAFDRLSLVLPSCLELAVPLFEQLGVTGKRRFFRGERAAMYTNSLSGSGMPDRERVLRVGERERRAPSSSVVRQGDRAAYPPEGVVYHNGLHFARLTVLSFLLRFFLLLLMLLVSLDSTVLCSGRKAGFSRR